MIVFLSYILKVSLTLSAFYLFYTLLCSRDTWHRANRLLLLFILALSAVVPFMYIDFGIAAAEAAVEIGELDSVFEAEPVEMAAMPDEPASLWQRIPWELIPWRLLLVGLYLAGLAAYIVKFIGGLASIVLLIRKSKRHEMADGTILVTHTKDYSPFSWMHYIIVSESDLHENHDMILAHERAHIRLLHSWDLLFVQLCATVQWFNPAAWLLKRELEAIHEYEADSATLRQGFDAHQYQLRLFEAAVGVKFNSMTNNFTNCSTKKRIIMMMKKQTSPWALLKALYVLPVAFAAVAVISCTSPREKKADFQLSNITVSGDNPLLVFTFEDSTEVNIQGKRLNPDGNPDFDYLKVCGLTSENIDGIAALQSEEAEAIFGRSGVNGAIRFQVKGKTAKDMTTALAEYAQHIGSEGPLRLNIKRPAGIIDEIRVVGYNSAPKAEEQGEIFQVVEEQPMFPGGMEEMMKFLQQNIKYPTEAQEQGKQGRVIVQFVVNKDGSISNDSVVRSVDPLLDAEALRVVRSMPNWKPGKQRGKEVRVRFTIPVSFRLSGGSTDKAQESAKVAQTENASSRDEIFQVVEEMPEYPGGMSELMKYLSTNMRYPKEAQSKGIQGRVIVQFVVEKDGSITDAKVMKPVDPQLDAEALRAVNAMPKWTPGKQKGKAVRVRYTLPVMFHLK